MATVLNWLTTRTRMDSVLRLVFTDAEMTFPVNSQGPGRLEIQMAALLAALCGGAVSTVSAMGPTDDCRPD